VSAPDGSTYSGVEELRMRYTGKIGKCVYCGQSDCKERSFRDPSTFLPAEITCCDKCWNEWFV